MLLAQASAGPDANTLWLECALQICFFNSVPLANEGKLLLVLPWAENNWGILVSPASSCCSYFTHHVTLICAWQGQITRASGDRMATTG